MRSTWLALAIALVLGPATAAFAGRAKTKPQAARKADTAKQRSARMVGATSQARSRECTRVILEDVSFRELRLVGIVGHGRTQKALLMDVSDEAITIARGECLGIERVPYEEVVKPLLELASR